MGLDFRGGGPQGRARWSYSGFNKFRQQYGAGYYVGVTPMETKNGMVSFLIGSGIKAKLCNGDRFNAKTLEMLAHSAMDLPECEQCIKRVLEKDKAPDGSPIQLLTKEEPCVSSGS